MFRFHGFPDTLPLHKVEVCNRIRCVALQLFLITCIGESNLQPEGVVEGWVQHGLMSLANLPNSELRSSHNLHSCGGYVVFVSLPDAMYFKAVINSLYGIAENFSFLSKTSKTQNPIQKLNSVVHQNMMDSCNCHCHLVPIRIAI